MQSSLEIMYGPRFLSVGNITRTSLFLCSFKHISLLFAGVLRVVLLGSVFWNFKYAPSILPSAQSGVQSVFDTNTGRFGS